MSKPKNEKSILDKLAEGADNFLHPEADKGPEKDSKPKKKKEDSAMSEHKKFDKFKN